MRGLAGLATLGLILAPAAAEASDGKVVLDVAIDAKAGVLDLSRVRQSFLRPRLVAESRTDVLRLFTWAEGAARPTRWFVRIEERDPSGGLVRRIDIPNFTGRDAPPPFVNFRPDRPPKGAYVAWLELRHSGDDAAVSAPVVLPALGGARAGGPRVLAVLPEGSDVSSVLTRVRRRLKRPGVRLRVEGHWDTASDAEAQARTLAEGVRDALVAEALPADRMDVVGLAGTRPRFPGLSRALRRRNRRVELVAIPPPRAPDPVTRLAAARPRSLQIAIDGREAGLDLTATPRLSFTMDLDPPAQVRATLHDGRGGWARLARGVSTRKGANGAWRPVVLTKRAGPPVGPQGLQWAGGEAALSEDGVVYTAEVTAAEDVAVWAALVVSEDGRLVAARSGGGPPPPRIELVDTSSRAGTTARQLTVLGRREGGAVDVLGPVPTGRFSSPPLAVVVAGRANIELELSEALLALTQAPQASLLVQVHGGRRAERARVERSLHSIFEARGLDPSRIVWSAGRSQGKLTLVAFLAETHALRVPPQDRR